MQRWFKIDNIEDVDSPSIVLYKERLMHNIETTLKMVRNDPSRLMPHVKTYKMPMVLQCMIEKGIKRFKASTIAEAEMAAMQNARAVLVAHQLVGPKIERLAQLMEKYPDTNFMALVDNELSAAQLSSGMVNFQKPLGVYIDVNVGMDRTGISLGKEMDALIQKINSLPHIVLKGFHVYDGHFRNPDYKERIKDVENGIAPIEQLFNQMNAPDIDLEMICGGTPTLMAHSIKANRVCSPGTCILWDWRSDDDLQEQEFKFAALLVSRVVSKPAPGIVTIDLGHKSVASENPIHKRVKFLNLDQYELLSQNEEHGVIKVEKWEDLNIGEVLYGIPYHICPTINLYDEISVISDQHKTDTWEITGRKRRITV